MYISITMIQRLHIKLVSKDVGGEAFVLFEDQIQN